MTEIDFADGFYAAESDGVCEFRWMQPAARLRFGAGAADRFLELEVMSEFGDFSQEVIGFAGADTVRLPLRAGWSPVSFRIPAGVTELRLSANKAFPREYCAPGDNRTLTVRIRRSLMHDDPIRHQNLLAQSRNYAANSREMLEGRTELVSTPPRIGIDLYGGCNVKPPCVYCEWDSSKAMEGDAVDTPFTLDTLRDWGPFFENSTTMINCSIGEPFMMRNLDELLDAFGDAGKSIELTTNGQILTDRTLQRLVGRPIKLHVSLDAGTAETYAKLRNNRFDAIIRNLERLIAAKGGPGPYPHIHLVFMPMRLNVEELPAFIALCARLRVDMMVLRPLNYAHESNLNWDRSGYKFEYVKELLPLDELIRVSGRAAELCERAGLPFADQLGFGGMEGARIEQLLAEGRQSVRASASEVPAPPPVRRTPGASARPPLIDLVQPMNPHPALGPASKPACSEPWDSLYILRRGVLPCCYGAYPIAKMEEYREAWNSPLLQDIRRELAAGRFHRYCRESPSCPIVRKAFNDAPAPSLSPPAPPVPTWRGRVKQAIRQLVGATRHP